MSNEVAYLNGWPARVNRQRPLADYGIQRRADPAGSDEAQSLWNPGSVVNAPLHSHFRREQAWARHHKQGKPNQMQKIHVPCFPLSFNT